MTEAVRESAEQYPCLKWYEAAVLLGTSKGETEMPDGSSARKREAGGHIRTSADVHNLVKKFAALRDMTHDQYIEWLITQVEPRDEMLALLEKLNQED